MIRSVIRFIAVLLFPAFVAVALHAQKEMPISAVQGGKNISPVEGQQVRVTGVVTARIRSGFFLQTPDGKSDGDPQTSEAIFVFTKNEPPSDAAIGSEVAVAGKVEEFRHRSELYGLTITEISHFVGRDHFAVLSKGNPLPKTVTLTATDFKPNSVDQLEKYEGMRIAIAELTTVAPTGGRVDAKTETVQSDGVFFGVLKGTPRPFREPGMNILQYLSSDDREQWKKDFPKLPLFDMNPEILRIDSDEQIGAAPIDVSSKTELRDLTGVLHYAFGRYTILTDAAAKPAVAGSIKPIAMPTVNDRQFSVTAANIETLVDDVDDPDIKEDVATTEAFQKRLGKVSTAVRDLLNMPDIFAVIEAENLNVLKKLAERINADAVAAGKPNPNYEACLVDGNDPRGIDVGFLVKRSRVTSVSAKQFGKDERFRNPVTGNEDILNDRPPLAIEATITNTKTGQPFAFTLVANHLKSLRGVDDPKDGPAVRMKKKLQAEFLAKWVNERQKANPNERILLVGDFNAFQFSDGLVDQIGTIKGTPTAKDAVLLSSDDLVNPDLTDLVELIKPDQQYSYTFDGSAQVLDHFLANAAMKRHLSGFGYLRVNADYPQVFREDGKRPERFSDHDVAVGYFSFDDVKPRQ
jgi:hypothetical protein